MEGRRSYHPSPGKAMVFSYHGAMGSKQIPIIPKRVGCVCSRVVKKCTTMCLFMHFVGQRNILHTMTSRAIGGLRNAWFFSRRKCWRNTEMRTNKKGKDACWQGVPFHRHRRQEYWKCRLYFKESIGGSVPPRMRYEWVFKLPQDRCPRVENSGTFPGPLTHGWKDSKGIPPLRMEPKRGRT